MPKRNIFKKQAYLRVRRRRFSIDASSSTSTDSTSSSDDSVKLNGYQTERIKATPGDNDLTISTIDISRTFLPLRTSSPVIFESDTDSSASSNNFPSGGNDSANDEYDDACSDDEERLYYNSNISVKEFTTHLAHLTSKHSLSDAANDDILKLFSATLPLPNKVPSLYKHKSNCTENMSNITKLTCVQGEIFFLPFEDQLLAILNRYPGVEDLCVSSCSSAYSDITSGKLFPCVTSGTVYFILNTDGFSPVLSRKIQVWPLLLSLVNLSPGERRRLCNIIMAGFYIGTSPKPDWNVFLESLISSINDVYVFRGKSIRCKVVALVADSPARCSCCFIQNMNARYVYYAIVMIPFIEIIDYV